MEAESTQKKPGRRFWNSKSIAFSVAVHVAFLIAAGFIIALKSLHKPEAQFISENNTRPRLDPRKVEMKVKVKDLQKRSARPKLQPRLQAMAPAEIALPQIKKTPKPVKRQVRRDFATVGVSGFGSGIGGGMGDGFGGGFGGSFFGLKSTGKRFAFIIDYSASMKGVQYNVMRNELSKSIDELPPGAEVFLTFFSGPAWVAGENPNEVKKHWEKRGNTVKLKKNAPKPKIKWTRIAKSTKKKLLEHIKDTPMSYGTDWANPFRLVFDLVPKPDVIYFMTDGAPQAKNEDQVMKMVKEWNSRNGKKIPINAIAIGDPRIAKNMEGLAKDSNKGQFTVVDTGKYKFSMGFKRGDAGGNVGRGGGGKGKGNKNKNNPKKKKV